MATITVMNGDSKHESRTLSSNVTKRNEIRDSFGKTVYDKGAAIIDMLEATVGESIYKASLQSFIKHHLYDNSISEDFAKSLER